MKRWHLALVGLLLLTSAVYAQGLWSAGFVWDDLPLIVMNDSLGRLDTVPAFFGGDLWADSAAGSVSSGYYRPLVLLSFSLDKALFGSHPLGYHLHSLAWHLIVVLALFALLKDMVGEGRALLGATIFALHPVQSECVAWISARNDLMAAAFGLLSLLVLRSRGRSSLRWWLGAGLAAAAVLSKESAVLLPLLAWVIHKGRGEAEVGSSGVGAICLGIGLALGMRVVAGVGGSAMPPMEGWVLVGAHAFEWIGTMMAAVVWPAPVTSAHDLHWTDLVAGWRIGLGWAVLLGLLCVSLFERGRDRHMALGGLVWAAAGLALVVIPMADKGGFGGRFWYLPLFGLALTIAAITPRRLAPWVSLAVAIPSVVVLTIRLPDWHDDAQMWAAAARDVPSPVNHVGLAHAMAMNDRPKRAHVGFVGALSTDRLATDACNRVVGSARRMGRASHAARMGTWALERGCAPSNALVGALGAAQVLSGDWDAARSTLTLAQGLPSVQMRVVAAAIAKRTGDEAGLERAVGGEPEIAAQAALLVAQAAKPRMTE